MGSTLYWVSMDVHGPCYGWSMCQALAMLLVPDNHHHSVMLLKPSQCSRSCSPSMVSLRPSDLIMDHNLPAINLPSLLRSGTLITQVHLGTQGVMAKLKLLSRLQKVSSPMPNTQGRIPTLPCWHTGAHPSMFTFVHQLRCSTRDNKNHCASKDQAQGPPSCS